MIRAYRVFDRRYAASAWTGEGASRTGGRWNSKGVAVVYASTSLALALLEIMVNARRRIPPGKLYSVMTTPDDVAVESLDSSALPRGWYRFPAPPALQAIGDAWVRDARSVALLVPSAATRVEQNVLLNPRHADFALLQIATPRPVPIDERLRGDAS